MEKGCSSLIPEKSKQRYGLVYNTFRIWLNKKGVHINEKNLLMYFVLRSERMKFAGTGSL